MMSALELLYIGKRTHATEIADKPLRVSAAELFTICLLSWYGELVECFLF